MPGKIFHHTPPLERFEFPGSYQLLYLVTDFRGHQATLCPDCATKAKHEALMPENAGFLERARSVYAFVNWEGPPETCEDCGEEFPSEYGEVEEQDTFEVGDRVEGGEIPADYDTGEVRELLADGQVIVAWDSGQTTTQHRSVLRLQR